MPTGKGRAFVGAPRASAIASTLIGTGDGTLTTFSHGGDTTLTTGIAAGATGSPTSLVVAAVSSSTIAIGFVAGETVIFEPGTDREEEMVLHSTASDAATDLNIATGQTFKFAHPAGSRIVSKKSTGPIRPGSLVIAVESGTGLAAIDDGAGNIIAASGGSPTAIGTIDYSLGVFRIVGSAAITMSKKVTFTAEKAAADALINNFNGDDVYQLLFSTQLARRDVPDGLWVKNVGPSEIGIFIEKTQNNGTSYIKGGGSAKLAPGARKFLEVDSGMPATSIADLCGVRWKVSTALTNVSAAGAVTTNSREDSMVEVTPFYALDDNGQA